MSKNVDCNYNSIVVCGDLKICGQPQCHSIIWKFNYGGNSCIYLHKYFIEISHSTNEKPMNIKWHESSWFAIFFLNRYTCLPINMLQTKKNRIPRTTIEPTTVKSWFRLQHKLYLPISDWFLSSWIKVLDYISISFDKISKCFRFFIIFKFLENICTSSS